MNEVRVSTPISSSLDLNGLCTEHSLAASQLRRGAVVTRMLVTRVGEARSSDLADTLINLNRWARLVVRVVTGSLFQLHVTVVLHAPVFFATLYIHTCSVILSSLPCVVTRY